MELKDTIKMMESPDYKERFRAEFFQLYIRMEKLYALLEKMAAGTLDFTPSCSFELLAKQHVRMAGLINILEERAKIEGIDLTMPD